MRRRLTLLIAGLVAGLVVVAGTASAADAPPEVALTLDKDQFQPSEIKVKANTPFVLVVTNKNAKAAEFESKDLRVEKVVPAGKTVNVRIRALKPGTYAFFDDFNKSATGRIVAE
jgi:plastocyanin domain-containing protein